VQPWINGGRSKAFVVEHNQAVLAGCYDIQPARAAQIGHGEMNAAAFASANGAVVDDLFGE